MSQQRRGLGKGLGALIPTAPATGADGGSTAVPDGGPQPIPGTRLEELAVGSITPNPRQPRQTFDEDAIEELAASIREVGLLQPIVVRRAGPGRYELIMGERRWRAAKRADLRKIPAIVRETEDDELLREALIENLHREQLNPLEEAAAYQQLLAEFGATHEGLAAKIGRSRPHITNTLRLLNLPPEVQRRVAAGVLSAGHARALLAVEESARQGELAQRVVAEGLSVRALEELVALGAGQEPTARRAGGPRKPVAPALQTLAGRLSDVFDTRVKVDLGKRKGKIVLEFASLDDLERIVKTIDPPSAAALHEDD